VTHAPGNALERDDDPRSSQTRGEAGAVEASSLMAMPAWATEPVCCGCSTSKQTAATTTMQSRQSPCSHAPRSPSKFRAALQTAHAALQRTHATLHLSGTSPVRPKDTGGGTMRLLGCPLDTFEGLNSEGVVLESAGNSHSEERNLFEIAVRINTPRDTLGVDKLAECKDGSSWRQCWKRPSPACL